MSLENIKKYFEPKSILDIGANVGQFYNESKVIFPEAYYYLIEGSEHCDIVLKTLNVDYSISLLSNVENMNQDAQVIQFTVKIHHFMMMTKLWLKKNILKHLHLYWIIEFLI